MSNDGAVLLGQPTSARQPLLDDNGEVVDPCEYLERQKYMIEFFAYETIGISVGAVPMKDGKPNYSMVRADFE